MHRIGQLGCFEIVTKYDDLVAESARTGKKRELDSSEVFIHGILSEKRTGTCASLPVFAVALGRRCGFPLYNVYVPSHGLYRWHGECEKFNYQHTESGGDIRPDEYYHTWPVEWTERHFALNAHTKIWLYSLAARREVSKFLWNRALQLHHASRYGEALDSLKAAARFDPLNPACEELAYHTLTKMGADRLGTTFDLNRIINMDPIIVPSPVDAAWAARRLPGPVTTFQRPHDSVVPPQVPAAHQPRGPIPTIAHPKQPKAPTPFDHLHNHGPQTHAPHVPYLLPKLAPPRVPARPIMPQPSQPSKESPR
jgi:hypothetical protein